MTFIYLSSIIRNPAELCLFQSDQVYFLIVFLKYMNKRAGREGVTHLDHTNTAGRATRATTEHEDSSLRCA